MSTDLRQMKIVIDQNKPTKSTAPNSLLEKIMPVSAYILGVLVSSILLLLVLKIKPENIFGLDIDTQYVLVNYESGLTDNIAVPVPKPPEVKDRENPINGVKLTRTQEQELRTRIPIAITINNHTNARHQSGLSQADWVYEVLAEGGITRYVGIFYGNYDVPKIGPVRSLRYYMIEMALGYDNPVILHHGWAGYDNASWETYRERADARGAVRKWGVKSLQTAGSTYRDMEKAKSSGYVHSLYTDFGRIKNELDRYKSKWAIESNELQGLKFKEDSDISERGIFKQMEVKFIGFKGSDYNSKFVYDKEMNCYKRFVGGKEDIDLNTNKQICPKTVVLEWHNYGDANDGHARLIIDIVGEDKVVILRDGQVIEGKWKKPDRNSRCKYFDDKGNEIALNRGLVWDVIAIKVGDRLVSNVTME